jgi:diguanylate cyclase (GGDEF)-like protein/PAS domain S-box-containing protein
MDMATRKTQGYPVLIIGAGRGGSALLEMFLEDNLVEVMAIADSSSAAPGIRLAESRGIPVYASAAEALQACKDCPDCIVYNLSHDDSIAEEAARILGNKRVTSGPEVKLFWQMVTNLKQVKGDLEKSQSQLQAIIHNVMDAIITTRESGEILGFNPAAESIFGYLQHDILGRNLRVLMPELDQGGHEDNAGQHLQTGLEKIASARGRREMAAIRKNGEQFPVELLVSEMMLGGQRYFIGIARDITERKQAEEKITHLAFYDYLTDLPNRALFMDNLEHCVALAKRDGYKVAILFLDLDEFKQVNDTLGHDGGDLLLQEVAQRLKTLIRASDMVARIGGDEFIFVLNKVESGEGAALIANKLIAALSQPFDIKGRQCHVGGSIGISIFPDDSGDSATLVRQADEAMYLAKQAGKNTYRLHQ